MPVAAPVTLHLTPEDYFAWEETQEVKHEYVHGEVFPMPGATREHTLIATNFVVALAVALRERACTVFGEGMRVQIEDGARYTYPDLCVVCGEERYADDRRTTLANPTLVVEVLSRATASYDRGEKLEAYRQIVSLQQIVLVAQDRPHVEIYSRDADAWTFREAGGGETVDLGSVGVQIALDDLYAGV